MPSLIKAISLQWDLWIEQYRAFFPEGREDLEACAALIHEAGTLDGMRGEEPKGKHQQWVACQDTRDGRAVACLLMADAATVEEEAPFALHQFSEEQRSRMAVFSQLAVHPEYEKSQALLVLLSHSIVEVLKAGGQAVLMSCDPGHYSIYKRMGMRPVGPLGKTNEGLFRIPMIFLPDQEYLFIIHSPVLPLMRGVDFNRYQAFCNWYYQLVRDQPELKVGSAFYPDADEDFEGHHTITEGLSEKGRKAFLKNALVIKCREGEVLITENDGGKSFGYVRHGLVRVVIKDKTAVLLGEGDIIGEIAFILHTKRSARVVAASPDTEVVLFSESALSSLESESDRTAVWRNLARVLAQRVVLTNKLLEEKQD